MVAGRRLGRVPTVATATVQARIASMVSEPSIAAAHGDFPGGDLTSWRHDLGSERWNKSRHPWRSDPWDPGDSNVLHMNRRFRLQLGGLDGRRSSKDAHFQHNHSILSAASSLRNRVDLKGEEVASPWITPLRVSNLENPLKEERGNHQVLDEMANRIGKRSRITVSSQFLDHVQELLNEIPEGVRKTPAVIGRLLSIFRHIKQVDSVDDYVIFFVGVVGVVIEFVSHVDYKLEDQFLVMMFMVGLKEELRYDVQILEPKTLLEAIDYAQVQEKELQSRPAEIRDTIPGLTRALRIRFESRSQSKKPQWDGIVPAVHSQSSSSGNHMLTASMSSTSASDNEDFDEKDPCNDDQEVEDTPTISISGTSVAVQVQAHGELTEFVGVGDKAPVCGGKCDVKAEDEVITECVRQNAEEKEDWKVSEVNPKKNRHALHCEESENDELLAWDIESIGNFIDKDQAAGQLKISAPSTNASMLIETGGLLPSASDDLSNEENPCDDDVESCQGKVVLDAIMKTTKRKVGYLTASTIFRVNISTKDIEEEKRRNERKEKLYEEILLDFDPGGIGSILGVTIFSGLNQEQQVQRWENLVKVNKEGTQCLLSLIQAVGDKSNWTHPCRRGRMDSRGQLLTSTSVDILTASSSAVLVCAHADYACFSIANKLLKSRKRQYKEAKDEDSAMFALALNFGDSSYVIPNLDILYKGPWARGVLTHIDYTCSSLANKVLLAIMKLCWKTMSGEKEVSLVKTNAIAKRGNQSDPLSVEQEWLTFDPGGWKAGNIDGHVFIWVTKGQTKSVGESVNNLILDGGTVYEGRMLKSSLRWWS